MKSCLYNLFIRNLFSFKGRASRKEYIYKILLFIILLFINELVGEYIDNNKSWFWLITGWLFLIFTWISIFQYFPLAVRRLHDFNVEGWFVLISFVPFGQLLILWLMFKKGTDGVNDYGEAPEY